jgi:hypothetical protein
LPAGPLARLCSTVSFLQAAKLYYHFSTTDIDECTEGIDNCHQQAMCQNTDGSFICYCNNGWTGNGTHCTGKEGINWVSHQRITQSWMFYHGPWLTINIEPCQVTNGVRCQRNMNVRLSRNSWDYCIKNMINNRCCVNLLDIDECSQPGLNDCNSINGTCLNNDGGYTCACKIGFTGPGDGRTCFGT